jgi:hypothetical protein
VFIVQCKKLRKTDVTVSVTTASSKVPPAIANDFLNQGMNFVTAPHGCISMSDEPAKTIAPAVPAQLTILEDTVEGVAEDLLGGQYDDPVRVIGFDTIERKLLDVSEEVARELRQRCADQDRRLPEFLQGFIERYAKAEAQQSSKERCAGRGGAAPTI